MKYFKVLKQLIAMSAGTYLASRLDIASYFLGKLVRFGFFLLFLLALFTWTDNLVGYSAHETILFFLTFNLIDVLAQAFFRGIYLIKNDVKQGNFDFALARPVSPLFYSMLRMVDILDIIFLLPIIGLIIWAVAKLNIVISVMGLFAYLAFVFLSLILVLAIHVLSAAVTIYFVETENFIWLYRELMTIGRVPPEIFSPAISFLFTFIFPIIIIVAFPVKIILGILTPEYMILSIFYAAFFFLFSLVLWEKALLKYGSASS